MKFIIAIVSLSIVLIVAAAGTCRNPTYQAGFYKKMGIQMPKVRAGSLSKSNNFCGNFALENQCCAPTTLTAMKKAYAKYEKKLRAQFQTVLEKATTQCDKLDALSKKSSSASKLENKRAQILEVLADSADSCLQSALLYTKGMMCMGCSKTSFVENKRVQISQEDVDDLHVSCGKFLTAHKRFNNAIAQQEATIRNSNCKHIRLTKDSKKSVRVCLGNREEAFVTYLKAVSSSLVAKYEFETEYETSYEKGKVQVCDKEGCEQVAISAQAVVLFKKLVEKNYNLKTVTIPKKTVRLQKTCDDEEFECEESTERAAIASVGAFFDFDSLMKPKKTFVQHVEFVEDGGFKPIESLRQSASVTTNTTASGNLSSKVSNITGMIKGGLANATAKISSYFNSGLTLNVVAVPLALLGLALVN